MLFIRINATLFAMNLHAIRIVLVATSHPGNIGATARAMKNMGLSRLYLVNPQLCPDQRSHEMAAGADDLLNDAIITTSLTDALRDCRVVYATSARARDLSLPGLTPAACAKHVATQPEHTEIAIVFGREHAGLTNKELLQCHYHIHIPSNPAFSSLNLAQAVQIIAYELRMKLLSPPAHVLTHQDAQATVDDQERFYTHLEQVLIEIDFINPQHPKRLLQRLRRMFNRMHMEVMELNLLRGILTQIQHACRKK